MEQLWAPWRKKYIEHHEPTPGCIFCNALQMADSVENLVVARAQHSFAMLNRYPYNNGHLMIVPYAHQPTLEMLDAATRAEMMELVSHSLEVLRAIYHPEAFNFGANIGKAAGAGIAAHLHLHVVPRWSGDTNFMSSIGETRVLPEELSDTYQRIQARWGA